MKQMQPSAALVRGGLSQLEKQKGRPAAQVQPKYVGSLRLNAGQIDKRNVEMDDDMVDPEGDDSFDDAEAAEDDQALQIAAGRRQKPRVEPDDDFDPNADVSKMTLQQ